MNGQDQRTGLSAIQTGIAGLDEVLQGGLSPNRVYLVEGDPGSGKTTLALQFLLEGKSRGESCMFVTLSESAEELNASARSHNWDLSGIRILENGDPGSDLQPEGRYTMYRPSEVELGESTRRILEEAERFKPSRLVFDSLAELRLLAEDSLRYRRQILALKRYFSRQDCTVLFIDDQGGPDGDMRLHSLAHGVISLERSTGSYGIMRRRIQITKMRGRAFREGYHDLVLRHGGLEVFPRLIAAQHRKPSNGGIIHSGLTPLDALLGGGLARGSSTLVLGAAGTGKSSLATQYVCSACERGESAAVYLFDESIETFRERSRGLGRDLSDLEGSGRLTLRQIDPAEMSPGEFSALVRAEVEQGPSRLIVIDSLSGYFNAMPDSRFLMLHLHELLSYLGQQGITTLLIMTQHGIFGGEPNDGINVSYLADTVILLRYFEALGEFRQAVSVIKKRTGYHERTIREIRFGPEGIVIGEPLREFHGVLTGNPSWNGRDSLPADGFGERHDDA